jgi:hypothetical protein
MANETAIDGENVALESGPSFNALQNYETATLIYYVFEAMTLAGTHTQKDSLHQAENRRVRAEIADPLRLVQPKKRCGMKGKSVICGTPGLLPARGRGANL